MEVDGLLRAAIVGGQVGLLLLALEVMVGGWRLRRLLDDFHAIAEVYRAESAEHPLPPLRGAEER